MKRLRNVPRVLWMLARWRVWFPLRVRLPRVARLLGAGLALCALVPVALAGRAARAARRGSGRPPRVLWGPVPIINIKYFSEALRANGIPSRTVVTNLMLINEPTDYDQIAWWKGDLNSRRPRHDYLQIARIALGTDIVSRFFDSGYMTPTPLGRLELPLLRLAGCRTVVMGYGGDIAVPGFQGPWEEGYQKEYPEYVEREPEVRAQIEHVSRWATVILRTLQPGYVPRYEAFWALPIAIDTDYWRPLRADSGADGRSGPVTVVHAPNHRVLKGTQSLLDAVEELRAEGLQIDLKLLERRPNREVRDAVGNADIVADQFNLGYQLFAVESLSAGKPVMTPTSWWSEELQIAPGLSDSPVVDSNTETVKDRLRELVTDPERRRRIGHLSREHALRYHSYSQVGAGWVSVMERAWRGKPLPSPPFVVNE